MSNRRKRCRSCEDLIPTELEDYLGVVPNICQRCLNAAIRELNKDEQQKYYGLEEIDI